MELWQIGLLAGLLAGLTAGTVWFPFWFLTMRGAALPGTRTGTLQQPWFAVYEAASGQLCSVATSIPDPLPPGLDVISLSDRYPAYLWDPVRRGMIEPEEYDGVLWGLPPALRERAWAAGKVVWMSGGPLRAGPVRPTRP